MLQGGNGVAGPWDGGEGTHIQPAHGRVQAVHDQAPAQQKQGKPAASIPLQGRSKSYDVKALVSLPCCALGMTLGKVMTPLHMSRLAHWANKTPCPCKKADRCLGGGRQGLLLSNLNVLKSLRAPGKV